MTVPAQKKAPEGDQPARVRVFSKPTWQIVVTPQNRKKNPSDELYTIDCLFIDTFVALGLLSPRAQSVYQQVGHLAFSLD